ncbi:MAG TPA: hypothetical protein VKQ34_04605 [Candidatus Saccharimonadales bacterium]|nr:hypothetical protein [Candidatus Saccharimonadales bacterium]
MVRVPQLIKKWFSRPAPTAQRPGPRKLKAEQYHSFHLQRRIKHKRPPSVVPGAFRLLTTAFTMLGRRWWVFGGLLAVYVVADLALVQGLSSSIDASGIKGSLDGLFKGNWSHVATGASLFLYLLGVQGSSGGNGSLQFMLGLMLSLAIIWTLRETYAGRKTRIRDGYYRGMYPFIPFILVLIVVLLECVPLAAGIYVYNLVASNGIAATGIEQALWIMLLAGLASITLYMLCSSIFALYIVCLPDMTPMRALKSARALAKYRRFLILRKLLFLPLALFIIAAAVVIPVGMLAASAAPWVLFGLSALFIAVLHSYMYTLYRSLI